MRHNGKGGGGNSHQRAMHGSTQALFSMVGGIVGTFLDGRYFALFGVWVSFSLYRSKALEGIKEKWLLPIHAFFVFVASGLLFMMGVSINRARPQVYTPAEYAAAVKNDMPLPITRQITNTYNSYFKPSPSRQKETKQLPCRIEMSEFSGCTSGQIIAWGKPVLNRLDQAIQQKEKLLFQRLAARPPKNGEMDAVMENAELNRYLENDYRNLLLYRAAILAKLNGGDPTPYDPMERPDFNGQVYRAANGEKKLSLVDIESQLGFAQNMQRYLKELTEALSKQK